jgi:GxxExxY protein
LLVEDRLIVEIKTGERLAPAHEAHVRAYLRASGMQHGRLMNLAPDRFDIRELILMPRGLREQREPVK